MSITTEHFKEATGFAPENDDMERVNCDLEGSPGHWSCGWCDDCNLPQFQCGCALRQKERRDEP